MRSGRMRRSLVISLVVAGALAGGTVTVGQGSGGDGAADPLPAGSLVDIGVDELRIRLAPLEIDAIAAARERALAELRAGATDLSAMMIERLRLQRATEPDADALARNGKQVSTLLVRKQELVSRVNVVLAVLEARGEDVASARAYVAAVEKLQPEETVGALAPRDGSAAMQDAETDADKAVRARTAELVAIVRGEPPAHERAVPWDVPLSEFELELQPLPLDAIVARLEQWREILQREVRKRVRIDILLNDGGKLEEIRSRRRDALVASGVADQDVPVEAIKARLAEESQEQQRIVNAIVERMRVATRLVEVRGGDASKFDDYVASATGQKLNLADMTVLRAQVGAWLRSADGGVKIGLNILKFVAIVLVFWLLARILGGFTAAGVRRLPRASSLLGPVLAGAVRRLTVIVGLVIGVSMFGVNIGPLLALIGAAGLVIGLALQGTLSNFASGILILVNRPYDVGDVITAGGVSGKVEAMNLVSTSILTFDNQLMLVPNNEIWNGVITNVTGKSTRRVDLTFGIGYADDMDKAIEIIRGCIVKHPKVREDPAPTIKVHELGDNSVNIIARPWTATSDYWDVYWDLMHEVKSRFDDEGVNIPYPQRDLHFDGPIEVRLAGENSSALAGKA